MVLIGSGCLTFAQRSSQNDGMASPDATPKPFQFGLRSIFIATSLIALAFGLLQWLRQDALSLKLTVAVIAVVVTQCAAVIAILIISKGTAWPSVVAFGLFAAFYIQFVNRFSYTYLPAILFWTSLSAWFGGGSGADVEFKRRSRFLRWAWIYALIWFMIVVVIESNTDFVYGR